MVLSEHSDTGRQLDADGVRCAAMTQHCATVGGPVVKVSDDVAQVTINNGWSGYSPDASAKGFLRHLPSRRSPRSMVSKPPTDATEESSCRLLELVPARVVNPDRRRPFFACYEVGVYFQPNGPGSRVKPRVGLARESFGRAL